MKRTLVMAVAEDASCEGLSLRLGTVIDTEPGVEVHVEEASSHFPNPGSRGMRGRFCSLAGMSERASGNAVAAALNRLFDALP